MSQVINLGTGSTPPPPGTFVEALTGNSGGRVMPDVSGNINLFGDSVGIVVIGSPGTNTLEIAITDLVPTNFDGDSGTANPLANTIVFTGGATGLVFNASGNTLELSGGALEVDFGGTGNNAFTPYAPITGGTTTTGILQSASTGISNVGYIFTSTGSSSLPTWQAVPASSISITGDSGGALTGNAFTFTGGTTGLTFSGLVSTETLTGTLVVSNGGTGRSSLTAHDLIIGNGTTAVTLLAPSATSGIPLISQGASADPAYGTAVVAGGGTGNTTFTAYSVITAGTTATGAFQNVSGLGSSGNILTSNGAGALPSWQAAPSTSITIAGDAGSPATGNSFTFEAGTGFGQSGMSTKFSVSGTTIALDLTDNNLNTTLGYLAADNSSGASSNTSLGYATLQNATSGSYNTVIGDSAGSSYTGSESSNILIGHGVNGTLGESHALRIGVSTGTGQGAINKTYIAGINGTNVGSVASVVSISGDQLGSTTITAGTNITVTPGANTITIASSATSFTWSVITANQTAAVNNGYFANKAGTLALALPASSAVGDIIEVTNENTALGVQFTQAAGQQILIGNTNTTSGATGTLTSSAVGDTLKIVCKVANTIWRVSSVVGNWSPV